MINFIVVGKSKNVVIAVLQAIRSFTDAKCIVIGDGETSALRWSSLCRQQFTLEFSGASDGVFVELVNDVLNKAPHAILIPADCEGIRMVNRVRSRLKLNMTPTPDLATLETFDDKWRFYRFCTEHRLPVPETRLFAHKSELDFNTLVTELGLPFVVKPVNQAGSLGVVVVYSRAQFEQTIRGAATYDYAPLIAQRFIDGADIDLSLLAVHGRLSAFAIQQAGRAKIQFLSNSRLEDIARQVCESSAYHGVMHIDARRERITGRIYLIESNPRFWATLTASVWCGLNFVAESLGETSRENGVLKLTSGTASTRHPIMRPSAWGGLLADQSGQGRLLRAMTFDLPGLGNFAKELPRKALRLTQKRGADAPQALSVSSREP